MTVLIITIMIGCILDIDKTYNKINNNDLYYQDDDNNKNKFIAKFVLKTTRLLGHSNNSTYRQIKTIKMPKQNLKILSITYLASWIYGLLFVTISTHRHALRFRTK